MKIIGLQVEPVARIFAMIYGALGFGSWIAFRITAARYFTLPLGIIGPFVHLNVNFNLHRSNDVFYNIFLLLASVASYAITGWLTAAAGVLCFNLVAKRRGGIPADFVSLGQTTK